MNDSLVPDLKSRKHAWIILLVSIVALLAYKLWKAYLRDGLSLDPTDNYLQYETFSTSFRILNSIIGVAISYWAFSGRSRLTGIGNRKVFILLLIYVAASPLIRSFFFNSGTASLNQFLTELPFNIFTGISEEFLFRGMMLAGLWYLSNFWIASIFSSLFFSLWHLDVTNVPLDLINLFLASLVYCLGFQAGVSLFGLSIIHFTWDQIHYGFPWIWNVSNMYIYTFISLQIFFIIVIFKSKSLEEG